ncbi:MAG: cupin domain-containing protein [Gemmatimonadota bacterium]|nr:cupin domain-containing protein [Gemmatimonadota bacterium]
MQEGFFVIAGEVVVRSETQTYTARRGSFVDIPTGGAVHSFKNESTEVAHLLCIVVPAGLEEMFAEVGKPVTSGTFLPPPVPGPEELSRLQAIARKYGQELFPPTYFSDNAGS